LYQAVTVELHDQLDVPIQACSTRLKQSFAAFSSSIGSKVSFTSQLLVPIEVLLEGAVD
jgi:hypothetical protein